ncbi:MAG TPA: hypothetical protein VK912_06755 [Longimicrobiales bacterium]|nr:hypothetical protein [Longimicrobiales bacterium]
MRTRRRKIHSPQAVGESLKSTAARSDAPSRELLLGLAMFAGLVPLLAFGPLLFPVADDVVSAAAAEGYNSQAAYVIAACWLLLVTGAAALLGAGQPPTPEATVAHAHGVARRDRGLQIGMLAVFLLLILVYFPPFLAAGGPYIEDQIHLTALHRMLDGQRPYTDFEFLYGPLMLYPARLWTQVFGYSGLSFYSYVAILEAIQYAALFAIVWVLVPNRNWRLAALIVVGGLMFNALVGPNWSSSRRLLGLAGMVAVAHAPLRHSVIATAAILLGLQLAYSHDVGVAALVGAGAMYALVLARSPGWRVVASGLAVAAGAAAVWFVTSRALLGSGFADYLAEMRDLTARFSAGEAGFRFFWTVNSLALFGTLIFAAVVIGGGLVRNRGRDPQRPDLLLLGAFAYALVSLKSGLNRADHWHLDAAIVPLAIALLAPPGRMLYFGRHARRLVLALLAITSMTYVFGLLPSGSMLASGWVHGAAATLASQDAVASPPRSRAPMIGRARTDSESVGYRLAVLLSSAEWVDRPVLFYSDVWSLPRSVGVFKRDPINDDFLYSDERGLRVRAFLEERPDAVVLMSQEVHDRLYGSLPADSFPEHTRRVKPTVAKRMAGWLSTPHYRGLTTEVRLKDERWRRTVGDYIRPRYVAVARTGRIIMLAPKPRDTIREHVDQ